MPDPFFSDPTQSDIYIGTYDDAGKVNRTGAWVHPIRLDAWNRGQVCGFEFFRKGITLPLGADPYLGAPIWVKIGGVLRFAGDVCSRGLHFSHARGLVASYRCEDLRARGEQIPVTDDMTGGDQCRFNLQRDDSGYLASRAGRSVGQVLISVLEMDAVSGPLAAKGIGGMTTGSGASFRAVIGGGQVTSATPLQTGSGYSASSPPSVLVVGGGYTRQATGTATVSGGAVTGISFSDHGAGYKYPPQILISRLPALTLADLAALDTIPPYECSVRGEKLLQALESTLTAHYPHHCLWVAPDGTLRFLDLLGFQARTLTFGQDPIDDEIDLAIDLAPCYSRVVCRSASRVKAVEESLKAGTLTEQFAYGNKTAAQAKASWNLSQFEQPALVAGTAAASAVLQPTSVGGVTITSKGNGYTAVPSVTFSAPDNVGGVTATGHTVLGTGSDADKVVQVVMDNPGSGYTKRPTAAIDASPSGLSASGQVYLTPTGIDHFNVRDVGADYSSAPAVWISAPTGSGARQATAHAVLGTGATAGTVQSIAVDDSGAGYTGEPTVHLSPPVPGSVIYGAITGTTDTLHVTIRPDDPGLSWPTDYYDQSDSGQSGYAVLSSSLNTGITASTVRPIVSNTALAQGGTCILTFDVPLESTSWDRVTIYSQTTGGSRVWRYYAPSDPAIAAAMTNENFSVPAAFAWADGAASLTYGRSAQVLYSSDGQPPYQSMPLFFEVDPDAGLIKFSVPTVTLFGTRSNLLKGGDATDGIPSDIRVLLPVYDRSLNVQSPADVGGVPQYAGTLHSTYGVDRTLTLTIPDWKDASQTAEVQKYCDRMAAAMRDAILEFSGTYFGVWTDALAPGIKLSLADLYGTTGLEAIGVPVVRTELIWPPDGAACHETRYSCSNRFLLGAATLYMPPPQSGMQFGIQGGDLFTAGSYRDERGTLHYGDETMSPQEQRQYVEGQQRQAAESYPGSAEDGGYGGPGGEDEMSFPWAASTGTPSAVARDRADRDRLLRPGGFRDRDDIIRERAAPVMTPDEQFTTQPPYSPGHPAIHPRVAMGEEEKARGPVAGAGGALGVGTRNLPIGGVGDLAYGEEEKARGPIAGAGGALGVGSGPQPMNPVGDFTGGGIEMAALAPRRGQTGPAVGTGRAPLSRVPGSSGPSPVDVEKASAPAAGSGGALGVGTGPQPSGMIGDYASDEDIYIS